MLTVYCLKIPEQIEKSLFDNLKQYLEEEKQRIVTNCRISTVKTQLVVSDILKKTIICSEIGIRNKDIFFDRNEYGKPSLRHFSNFHFNVSHSGEWVVCATSTYPVGIDIEYIASINLNIAKSLFSKSEYCDFMKRDNAERLPFFYDLWTLKESYVKAVGKGLSIPLNSFSLKVSKDKTVLEHKQRTEYYYFKQYLVCSSYKMAVCALSENFPDSLIVCDFETVCEKFFCSL